MARPVERGTGTGRWSRLQISNVSGVSIGQLRGLERQGVLDPDALDIDDIVVARCAAAVADRSPTAGRSPSVSLPALLRQLAVTLREALALGQVFPTSWLLIHIDEDSGTLHARVLAERLDLLTALTGAEPVVLIPVGAWVVERDTALGLQRLRWSPPEGAGNRSSLAEVAAV